jgi:hypothetical protein
MMAKTSPPFFRGLPARLGTHGEYNNAHLKCQLHKRRVLFAFGVFYSYPLYPLSSPEHRIKLNAILAGKGSLRERGRSPLSRLSPSQTT